jgi:hypothetical protein
MIRTILRSLLFTLTVSLLALGGTAFAGQAATTRITSDLKAEPYLDAETIASIPEQSDLEIISRKGGWYQVNIPPGSTTGWMRMTSVRIIKIINSSSEKSANGEVLENFITTGRSGSSDVSAATGVRGLDEEDLKNAEPDEDAVKSMDKYAANEDTARSFASSINLNTNSIEYLVELEEREIPKKKSPTSDEFGDEEDF